MPKISIIVPVYNSALFLERYLDSIINQTFQDFELILIEDGSDDKSPQICKHYQQKDRRIQLFYEQHSGQSVARNLGLTKSQGKYICFIDSDDYIDITMFEKLYNACIENDCKVSSCGFLREFDDKSLNEHWTTKEDMLLDRDGMMEYLYAAAVGWGAWNKLYDISLFDDVRYPYGKTREDEYTTYKIFCKVDKLYYLSECLYFYYQRDNSITGVSFSIKNLDSLEALQQAMEFHKKNGNKKYYNRALEEYIRDTCEFALKNNCEGAEKRKIDKILKKDAKDVLKNNHLDFIKKLKLLMVSYCIGLYRFIGVTSRKIRGFQ